VIAEAAGGKLTARERGALVRRIAARSPAHPDGSRRTYSRVTIDRWLRAWREGGLDVLKPAERSDTGTVRAAWAEHVANRRRHAETGETPISRFEKGGPHRQASPGQLREAFRWSVTRKATRTATVPREGNAYAVDPALTGRRVELRYDPEDLPAIDVFLDGGPAGKAVPFVTRRHVHRAVPQAARPDPDPTGIGYLGLVAAAHDDEAGTGAKIDFTRLGRLAGGTGGEQR